LPRGAQVKSPFDGRTRRPLAWLLAFLFARQLWAVAGALESTPQVLILAAVGLVAIVVFAWNRKPLLAGAIALTAMSVLAQMEAMDRGPMRHQFAVGVALLGWLCGLALGTDEALPEIGAAAALMATYVDAGISKLLHHNWAESATLRAMLVSHHRVDDGSLYARYVDFVVTHARAAEMLSWATLVVQLGAVLFLVGPRWRILWGTLLLLFHLQVALLSGIGYTDAMCLLAAWSYPWPLPRVLGSS
jgi:hypothetical protein